MAAVAQLDYSDSSNPRNRGLEDREEEQRLPGPDDSMGAIDHPDSYPDGFGSPTDLEVNLVVMLLVELRLALKPLQRSVCSPQDT